MDPFSIASAALLRPKRFAAFLDNGWYNIFRATIAVLLWVGVALAFVSLVLPQLLWVGTQGMVAGLVLAPVMALMIAAICIMIGSGGNSTQAHIAFWLLRCQIAITPPLALFLTLALSRAFVPLQSSPLMVFLLLALLGLLIGGSLVVIFALRQCQDETPTVRWVVAGGTIAIGTALWWSPPLHTSAALLFVPFCIGLALGVIRPISFLCELPLSLALALAARFGVTPFRLLSLHPASYDDLCLLPLPGLSGLLIHGCAANLEIGGEWLLRIAQHASQRCMVERAIVHLAQHERLAHPLLFWLSTSEQGATLLAVIAEQSPKRHPLITAYAAFAQVSTPDLWPFVLAQQREVIVDAVDQSGGKAVLALLETGIATLQADRWPVAIRQLESVPAASGIEIEPIWTALAAIRAWATDPMPVDIIERAAAAAKLVTELEDLDSWPIALIATICEHLLFLFRMERHRGAWLV